MDKSVFDELRKIVYDKSGIALGDNKLALVSSRINKRLRAHGMSSREYLNFLKQDSSGEETIQFLNVISTNTTNFFREKAHFDLFCDILRLWEDEGQRRFRIWSAACSSGEEPYTLAMLVKETLRNPSADVRILATDISLKVLDAADRGAYDAEKVKDIPGAFLAKYFTKRKDANRVIYTVNDSLKKMILFKRINLSDPPFPMKGPMDIIFCRNVMIYFDNIVRKKLVDETHRLLKSGGYLMVGHSESLAGIKTDLKPVQPAVYIKE